MPATAKKKLIAIEDIAATTLRGDVRDFLMGWFCNTPKPWPKMSQAEQANFASAADKQAEALVRAVTNLIGAQGFRSFEVSVGDFQKKGNRLEAKIAAPYSRDNLIEMAEAGESGPIVLSLVSLETFQGERAPAKVMPDQPDLIDGEEETEAEQQAGVPAADAATAGANLSAGQTIDPETGEIFGAAPADDRDTGEQRLLTYGGTQAGDTVSDHQDDTGDDLAAGHQADALAGAGGTGALTQAEINALTPEQRANVDRLEGINQLQPGESEPIEDGDSEQGAGGEQAASGTGKPKRRGRRTAEQRTADNARAADAGRMI